LVEAGENAPNFELDGSDGRSHTLSEFEGRYLVLYFYPKDDTPGCTMEAKGFSGSIDKIRRMGAEVVGISKDDTGSHEKFCSKYSLKILLLSDPGAETIKRYGAWGDRGIFGMGTLRKTFVIDRDGKIVKVYPKVQPQDHEKEIIEFLRGLDPVSD
jgi:peroxiredoxin Q/BCP